MGGDIDSVASGMATKSSPSPITTLSSGSASRSSQSGISWSGLPMGSPGTICMPSTTRPEAAMLAASLLSVSSACSASASRLPSSVSGASSGPAMTSGVPRPFSS